MGRIFAIATLFLIAGPAQAWQAGLEDGLCTLDHSGAEAEVRLTYDPSLPEYTIAIRLAAPWPEAGIFAMRFEGPRPNTISTARHVLSSDGRTLSVSDRGFGNVLDGLEFNAMALAASGERAVPIDLEGAAPEVAAFRACITAPTA
ncbi:MAG: hypothetical protein HLUCCO18_11440 [Rhodobacteraceae bacterium HLUCCO18]|nr:MAG: hypothetical protein HLUCCO18_11440 [Rhodobacteraceae bacterium HLUCCO18]